VSGYDTLLDGRRQTMALYHASQVCDLHCVPRTDERTRVELADVVGMTMVHPNRTLKTLARAGLICSRRPGTDRRPAGGGGTGGI